MNCKPVDDSGASPVIIEQSEADQGFLSVRRVLGWVSSRRGTIRSMVMISSAGLLATALGLVGSLVQARFITPADLGFIRKYSVVGGYATFLSFGLFIILLRDYPVLIGRGEVERARRTVAIVQSWCLLVSAVICGGLLFISSLYLFQGHWREASAWFIQTVLVWATLYGGYLTCTFRSGQEFERLAKGQFLSSFTGILVLPFFLISPFLALVLRSIAGPAVSSVYLHVIRPVKVGWCLAWGELLNLIKRGLRLYISDYLRYIFWFTVEIWLMLRVAGDAGVGLFVFSKMIAESINIFSTSINQVYIPRIGQRYGQSGNIRSCLRMGAKPVFLNMGCSLLLTVAVWVLVSPVLSHAFPKYCEAAPLIRILVLQSVIVSISLPLFMVTLLEGYLTQLAAAIVGLGVFLGTALSLKSLGFHANSVAWGTVAGQAAFALMCLIWIFAKAKAEGVVRQPRP